MPAKKADSPAVEAGYSVVVAPFTGAETTVPDDIKKVLIESGYTEK